MNRFMGGFATATVILIAATVAGHKWLAIGFAVAVFTPAVWLLARAALTRRADLPPVQPDPYAVPQVFAARGDAPRPAVRTRR